MSKKTSDTIDVRLHRLHPGQQRILANPARFKTVMCGRRFGKALALDTPIPTPSGWTTMGALKDGDTVFDEQGQPCTVVQAHDVLYDRPCYRVTFSDGSSVVADEDHLWLTWNRRERKNVRRNARSDAKRVRDWGPPRNDQPKVRTTAEIRDTLAASGRGDTNHSIPCTAPVEGSSVEWPIDPYVLGAWLGDGASSGAKLYSNDQEIVETVALTGEPIKKTNALYEYALSDGKKRHPYDPERATVFVARLRALGVLNNKHIPPHYLRAHISDRLAMLQGLMDTDGHVTEYGHCEFTSVSRQLADDVLDLCLGLGIRATCSTGSATIDGRFISPKYRIKFTTDLPVFRLSRKANRLANRRGRGSGRNINHRFIVAVEPVPSVPVRCITVDSPSRLYLCSKAYIPTHNTAVGIRWICDGALAGQPVGWFAPSYKFALEAWRELVQRLKPVTTRISEQDKRLELMTGGVIEVWTLDGDDPARGRKYARVVIDEAGIVRELLDQWQQAIRPTLVDLGGQALILGTPKGRRHGFVTLFNRGLQPDEPEWASFRASTLDNPHIPPEEVEAARKELPPEVFAQEFEGIPTDDGANPFGLDAVRACVGDLSIHPTVVYGLDLARAADYTVLIGLDAWRRVTYLDRWQAPWSVTKEKVRDVVGQVPVVADATGVGDAIVADLDGMGVAVTPHVFTQPSKLRLMQRLVTAFQGKELTIPTGWLIAELEAFEFTYTASGIKYEAPKGLHDDGVMALGLALHGWDRVQGVPPEAFTPLRTDADDPILSPNAPIGGPVALGSFAAQLPAGGW